MAISAVPSVRGDIDEMLSKIRDLSAKTPALNGKPSATPTPGPSAMNTFDKIMNLAKESVNEVNSIQTNSQKLQDAYSMGDKSVSLSQVVASSQKSKIALEGLMIVRNKVLDAYKEIMSMPT